MKAGNLLFGTFLYLGLLNYSVTIAQSTVYVKQIITANSGKFETEPPFSDYVTLQTYNPQTRNVDVFNTIYTQSAQSMVIFNHMIYIAAQDSIVKYDLNAMQRKVAIADSGLNQMAVFNGKLIVSKQYPLTKYFVEVLDTATLGEVAEISGITGDCGGITSANDTLYVAVDSGYQGKVGKLAIIDPSTWTLITEVNLGSAAVGIFDLYNYKGKIISVNATPFTVVDIGSITVYDPLTRKFLNIILRHTVGSSEGPGSAGIKDSLLFLDLDYGIGTFNLNKLAIQDSVIIHNPGTSEYIISAAVDTINDRIYTDIGDYATAGYCLVTDLKGDSLTSYSTGISSNFIVVDYRTYPSGIFNHSLESTAVTLFPNPVSDRLNISVHEQLDINTLMVTDLTGKVLLMQTSESPLATNFSISCRNLPSGMYYLILETSEGKLVSTFVKQ
jgi:hypothetical protein